MMLERKVTDFLEVLSSDAPVPGGGGASATVGAMGVALGMMVGNLTLGKKKYADVEPDIKVLIEKSQTLMKELIRLTDEDARVFEPLSQAYGLPRDTEEEKQAREIIMEKALLEASLVPMQIVEKAYESLSLLEELGEKGTKIAMSDVGVGALFARAALEGASLNIFINTKLMKDRVKAEELNKKAEAMIASGKALSDKVYLDVLDKIR
ncbi:cyclodeaminase/cyclohydrolase family protein [Hespellia stercorisuis]|uniref:Formimidoyltetrahydrofolate cyclodeaminase n=1 Tax=Hespellia stercorisuis DSM 15480 TaxID=1121950 RepID=A0A1M6MME8_9FIRM|nr:cyclodeaminase/cyclohydrolase family protein [Hespellia stercorisuis]SHJ84665.1 Formimidoyltetrahydrofolate cyclodeaminase [Hespellia stercorisuis DSM 15480]